MDLQLIVKVLTDASVIVGALLAIDNVLDGWFKALGYKEGDTFCAQIAEILNRAKSGLSSTTTTTTASVETTTTEKPTGA